MRKVIQILLCFVFCLGAGLAFTGCGADESDVVAYYFVLDFGNKATFSKNTNGNITVSSNAGNFTTTEIKKGKVYKVKESHKLEFTGTVNELPKSTNSEFLGWYYAERPNTKVELDGEGDLKVDISKVKSGDGSILIFPKFSGEKTKYEE